MKGRRQRAVKPRPLFCEGQGGDEAKQHEREVDSSDAEQPTRFPLSALNLPAPDSIDDEQTPHDDERLRAQQDLIVERRRVPRLKLGEEGHRPNSLHELRQDAHQEEAQEDAEEGQVLGLLHLLHAPPPQSVSVIGSFDLDRQFNMAR
jgi:hypothetical protein